MPNTAHAMRGGYDAGVGIGPSDLLTQPGENPEAELIAEMDEGLYIDDAGLSADAISGDLSATVDFGCKKSSRASCLPGGGDDDRRQPAGPERPAWTRSPATTAPSRAGSCPACRLSTARCRVGGSAYSPSHVGADDGRG